MSDNATRGELKQELKARMLEMEDLELATAIEHHERFLHDAMTEGMESHDNSEIAEARENADLAAAFDEPVHRHHAKIDVLENLDFALTDRVGPGAVVSFNGRCFIVAVSTTRFDHDGQTYMGISPQSPIYQVLNGLKAGDSFTHNGREFTLETVF